MTELIRISGGQETPAPGRWTIAPGQPVIGLAGPWWRQSRGVGHTTGGRLLITAAGSMSFQLSWGGLAWNRRAPSRPAAEGIGIPATSLTYQSFSLRPGSGGGTWLVDGELIIGGRICAARSTLTYHGVYRTGPGAIAWLGWQLPIPRPLIADSPALGGGRLQLSADLNADAPGWLNERHPVRRSG